MNWIELPLEPCHLGVPSGMSKTISEPMRYLAQTVHLSCTDTYTVSRRTKMRFHMTHVTYEFHRVHQKWFLSLWYVRHKPSTYLKSRLALSPNELNRAFTWASPPRSVSKMMSEPMVCLLQIVQLFCPTNTFSKQTKRRFHMTHVPRSSIGCVQNYLWACETFGANRAPILRSCAKISTIFKWTKSCFHLSLVP
jgi:hypothetical protein